MKTSNFNTIAPIYDLLVRLFFGSVLWKAQKFHLYRIRPDDAVLILGGGTGRILDWIPNGIDVTYLESSSRMMKQGRKKGKARFIEADFLTHPIGRQFDWVICPFFLDCFDNKNLTEVLRKIHGLLKSNGSLLITDFSISNRRQKIISMAMIGFFRFASRLQAKELLSIGKRVLEEGFIQKEMHSFRNEFIFSDIYKKKES